ncbi:MAG: septal ring lytic transglycosylase RlpA family protein [Desulfovibrio sp.]|jgi:rare lipoprotein A|nr:septal ring lytic transglycosylase RlpA family protein [Desulfovibrio sp.]
MNTASDRTRSPRQAGKAPLSRFCALLVAAFLAFGPTACSMLRGGKQSATAPAGVSVPKGARGTKAYTVRGKTYYPLLSSHSFREEGIASWYGPDFHGKKTANGENYDMYGMTAAHKLLPFGTKVLVTNKENGKSAVVRINDRGPFVGDRVIDLTRTAAERIGMIAKGTAPVVLQTQGTVAGLKDGDLSGGFYVQVGAFANKSNAERLAGKLKKEGSGARVSYAEDIRLYRVQAGPYPGLNRAEQASDSLDAAYPGNFVVAE